MRLTYTPDGNEAERRSWNWDHKRVRQSEAGVIERQYGGKPYEQFVAEAQGGSQRALRVLLWHLMRTQDGHAFLKLDDAPDPFVGEIEIEHTAAELREGMQNLERAALDPADREMAVSVLSAQIVEAEAREAGEVDAGK